MQDRILPITSLDLRITGQDWPFAAAERSRIDAHWQEVVAAKPSLWNGRILMCRDVHLDDQRLEGRFVETDFASFVAWRDWGWPDRRIWNLFGSAVIRSGDGALIYGRMAGTTLNPGHVYPPGGSLEPSDVLPDGQVDVLGSIERELLEETGLDAASADMRRLLAVFDGQRLSVAQVLGFPAGADELVARIERHRGREDEPELAGMVVLRSSSGITPAMPGYAAQIARFLLPAHEEN